MENVKIYTSYFGNLRNLRDYTPVAISRGVPQWYTGKVYQKVAPPYELLRQGISRDEYLGRYLMMLDRIGFVDIWNDLTAIPKFQGKPLVLLCYESLKKPGEWCHRTMLSEWMNGFLGKEVFSEVSTATAKTDVSSRQEVFQPTLF